LELDKGYANIQNYAREQSAEPLQEGLWYEVWYVVNNSSLSDGGQRYDVYMRGGEFAQQQLVYRNADFLANCNTGPVNKPYGNGGVLYDDIYMAFGLELSTPPLHR